MKPAIGHWTLPLLLLVCGCDGCRGHESNNLAAGNTEGTALETKIKSLIGGKAELGHDSAVAKTNAGLYLIIGHLREKDTLVPVISFFRWDGSGYVIETEVPMDGTGIPTFSERKAVKPAGIRNLNNFETPEILVRTAGDCGDGSTILTIISRDGKDRWTKIFAGCEGTFNGAKSAFESETAPDGNEVVLFKSFESEDGGFTLKKREAVIWDKEAWHVYKTRILNLPSTHIQIDPRKPAR